MSPPNEATGPPQEGPAPQTSVSTPDKTNFTRSAGQKQTWERAVPVDLEALLSGDYCEFKDWSEDPQWGDWHLDVEHLVLINPNYEIDLERCLTSAEVLDWILQFSKKYHASYLDIAGLVNAFDSVLTPQASLCSFGQPKRITDMRAVVDKYVNKHKTHGCESIWRHRCEARA